MTEELPTPASRKESYLAKAAGMAVTIPDKPESRIEQYLNAIANNGGGGGGGSYTAGNGINIANNTISVDTTTIQPKLTAGTNITISDNVISAAGGEPYITLSTSDYNYPTNNPNRVMMYKLDSGLYLVPEGVQYGCSSGESFNTFSHFVLVAKPATTTSRGEIYDFSNNPIAYLGIDQNGANEDKRSLTTAIVQSTGASTSSVMSQKAVTDALASAGGGVKTLTSADYNYPTTGTKTQIALWLLDDGYYIIPSDIKSSMLGCLDGFVPDVSTAVSTFNNYLTGGNIYTFAKFGNKFWFYSNTSNGSGMCIGIRPIMYGTINSSGYLSMSASYRVLCGEDIENNLTTTTAGYALDASQGKVLKDLITGTTESYTIASNSWTALSASSPYTYSTTVTATYTIGNDTIVELINDNAVAFSNYGFSIGSISSQSVTIYSIGQPSASVTLKVNYKG